MRDRECVSCIKRKTPYCPTSMECMATEYMPYYQNRMMLLKENQELKEKLDKYENPEDMTLCRDIASGHRKEFQDRETILLNQQKEFIKYLEDEIKRINPNDLDIGELNLRLDDIKFIQYLIYKEILQKYKEIIGVSDENSKN